MEKADPTVPFGRQSMPEKKTEVIVIREGENIYLRLEMKP